MDDDGDEDEEDVQGIEDEEGESVGVDTGVAIAGLAGGLRGRFTSCLGTFLHPQPLVTWD